MCNYFLLVQYLPVTPSHSLWLIFKIVQKPFDFFIRQIMKMIICLTDRGKILRLLQHNDVVRQRRDLRYILLAGYR